jgi:hypothetical protein
MGGLGEETGYSYLKIISLSSINIDSGFIFPWNGT